MITMGSVKSRTFIYDLISFQNKSRLKVLIEDIKNMIQRGKYISEKKINSYSKSYMKDILGEGRSCIELRLK